MATKPDALRRSSAPTKVRGQAVQAITRRLVETFGSEAYSPGETQATAQRLAEAVEPVLYQVASASQPVDRNLAEALAGILQAGEQPVRAAFLARALHALAKLASRMDERSLTAVTGATPDYAVLLQALEEPEALAALQESDPLAEARLRDLEIREQILASEGGTYSAEQVARLFGISRQAVDKRRRQGYAMVLPIGQHRYAYPAWQFGAAGALPGLSDVLAEFTVTDPWTQAAFFLSANTTLGGARPLDELRLGHVEAVRRAAWFLGRHGAS